MEKNQLDLACAAFRSARKIVILTHQNPDADTLGSALALACALRKMGKDATVLSEDGIPDTYHFIPDSDTVVRSTDARDFDLGVACDIQEPFRVDQSKEPLYSTKTLIVIDHHLSDEKKESLPPYTGQRIVLQDTTAAATAEIVVDLIDALGVSLDISMAAQLMAALVNDTGGFRFPNVTDRTFELAARLTRMGVSASEAAQKIYETKSFISTKLLGKALASLESDISGRIVWARITLDDFEALGATDADTESIVNHVRMVKGSFVGILFRELEEKKIRVSLRTHSESEVDVRKIAAAFGGGGHSRAAGCTVDKPLDEAIRLVVDEVHKWTGY